MKLKFAECCFAIGVTSVVFVIYSIFYSLASYRDHYEVSPLNISSIAINGPNFWIYTIDGKVHKEVHPKLSDAPSSKITYLYPQKWWYINIPVNPPTYNLNIGDLYNKKMSGTSLE